MKKLLIVCLSLLLVSCMNGKKVVIEKGPDLSGDITNIYNKLDLQQLLIESNDLAINNRVDSLEARVKVLEDQNLDARVTALENEENASQEDLDALKSQVNANTTAINNLTLQTNAISTQVSGLTTNVNNLLASDALQNQEIDELKRKVAELNQKMIEANNSILNMQTQINTNTTSIVNLNASVAQIQLDIASLRSLINSLSNKTIEMVVACGNEKLQKVNGKFYGVMTETTITSVSFTSLVPAFTEELLKVQYCDGLIGLNLLGAQICLGSVKFKDMHNNDIDLNQVTKTVELPMLSKVYLGELATGTTYTSTDGSNCKFKIENGNVVRL